MRHGEAGEARVDAERALTPRGRAQATATATGLLRLGIAVPVIRHSPYRRATETATAVAAVLGSTLVVDDRFTPSSSPDVAVDALLAERTGTFVVAHLPLLAGIVEQLVGARVQFATASVAHVVVDGGTGVLAGFWSSAGLERVS